MTETAEFDDVGAHVRRVDEDRWIASRFADARGRARLEAVYAFAYEVARVREAATDPLIGEIRLAWWREVIEALEADPAGMRRHLAAQALASAFADPETRPPRAAFEAVLDGRMRELGDAPFVTIAEFGDFAEGTAGAVMRLAASAVLDGAALDPAAHEALGLAGRAWGLTGMVRAFPHHAARGRLLIPDDALAEARTSRHALAAAHDPERARRALAPVISAARLTAAKAWRRRRAIPAQAWPAVGYVALTRGYLRALSQADDPYQPVERPLLWRQLRITASALTGGL